MPSGQLPKRQPYRGNQAFAYPVADLDILDANIRGVVKQDKGLNVYQQLFLIDELESTSAHRLPLHPDDHT